MTRLVSTSVLLGLALTGSALAQSSNDDLPDPSPPPPVDTDTTTTTEETPTPMNPDVDTTDTTIDANVDPDVPQPGDVDVDIDRDVNIDRDATAPADVDVNIDTPVPVVTDTEDYVTPPPAQDYNIPPPTYTVEEEGEDGYRPFSGVGIGIAAGGGAGGFTDDRMRGTAGVGGDWDVRATIGTRSPLAFEGSYIGSAQSIDALGLDGNAVLVGNGVQGALRLNATLDLPIQPFIFAGVGWRRYALTNVDQNLSDVNGSDDVLEIPMGLGIAGKWNGLILDARGEFRATQNEDLLPELVNEGDGFVDMHRWGVKATVGMEF